MPARPKITFVAPIPPPYAGPEISTEHLLNSPLTDEFSLIHVRSNLKSENAQKGSFTWQALFKQIVIYWHLIRTRAAGSRALYCLIAVNFLGFVKDAGTIWLGKMLGMRVVAHLKGATLPNFYHQSRRPLRWLIRRTVGSLDMLIVQGQTISEEITMTFDLDETRVPIIPNMIEGTVECPDKSPGANLLFIGHLSVGKGFSDLLTVMDEVVIEHPDALLRCIGEPKTPDRDYVARLVGVDFPTGAEGDINRVVSNSLSYVEYKGVVTGDDKTALICASDLLVLPSYSESFPIVVLEAMSHGCPVIATTVGAVPNMIVDGKDGILIEPGDRSALSSAIRRLLSDVELRERIGRAAREKIEECYTIEKVIPLYSAAFHELLR